MLDLVGPDNAIIWSQFRLRRGWKNILAVTFAYSAIIGMLIFASLSIDKHAPKADILYGWTFGLLGIQLVVVLVFGCFAVYGTVRKDITSGMIESHRLMDISGLQAVAGYLIGGTIQIIPVALFNVIIGLLTAEGGGLPIKGWLIANAVLMSFALFAWIAAVLIALLTQIGILGWIGAGVLFVLGVEVLPLPAYFPGLTVLATPIHCGSVFENVSRGLWSWGYQVGLIGQVLVGAVLFAGAVRRYRRDDVWAFGPLLGFALIALWILLSYAGISRWDEFDPEGFGMRSFDDLTATIIAMLMGLVVASIPIAAAAYARENWGRRRGLSDPSLPKRPVEPVLIAVLAGLMPLALPLLLGMYRTTAERMLYTGAVFLSFLIGVAYVARAMYRLGRKAKLVIGLWFFLMWTGPLIFDQLVAGVKGVRRQEPLTEISGCSPIGALILTWDRWDAEPMIGVIVQIIITMGLAILFHAAFGRPGVAVAKPALPVIEAATSGPDE